MITTAAIMEESEKKLRRPEAVPHNPSSLRLLATHVHEHAKKIEEAAALLEQAGPALSVKLNHLRTVEAGLTAIRTVVREIEMKIDNKKFIKITDARPEAKPAPPKGRAKR
jgi:glutamate mutase epsilon subunit